LNRTETVAFKNDDIRTWDLKKIVQETMTHYNLSLQSADSLKRTRISHFNDILLLGDSAGRKLRPTLYDFLAHRASGFFMHEEPGLTKPAYKFELAEPWYFDESEIFVEKKIETKDSLSLKYHASIILQEMVRFHLNDDDPKALIDAELQRLKFAKNNSIHASKDSLYLAVLNRLEKKFSKHPSSAIKLHSGISTKARNMHPRPMRFPKPHRSQNGLRKPLPKFANKPSKNSLIPTGRSNVLLCWREFGKNPFRSFLIMWNCPARTFDP